jgi:large subunit ribosomal protein L9
MKVILLKDVAKLGKRNTVVEVPDGYALNKLIPAKMALPATPVNLKRVEKVVSESNAQIASSTAAFDKALEMLKGTVITIQRECNMQGGLFEAVKPVDIARAFSSAGINGVPVDAISITTPIKNTGEHTITLSAASTSSSVTIVVKSL